MYIFFVYISENLERCRVLYTNTFIIHWMTGSQQQHTVSNLWMDDGRDGGMGGGREG